MNLYRFFLFCLLLCLFTSSCQNITKDGNSLSMRGKDFELVIQKGKNEVFPAVVFIKVLKLHHESGKKKTGLASGSGVLISSEGEILTNWHVVHNAESIRCLLYDGSAYDAKLIGSDKKTDVALIKLEMKKNGKKLPFASLDLSDNLKEGDFVMAMGAPWSLNRSVSVGIISCIRRYLPSVSEYSLWLQTDAAISPGNSGGPLVNTRGKIVGLNTRAVMRGGDMGFAVPAKTLDLIVPRLRKYGKVNWSWTGLTLQPLHDFQRDIYYNATNGVIVSGTESESPARKAGILSRDRLVNINGEAVTAKTIEDIPGINRKLGLLAFNKKIKVEIIRNGKNKKFDITPREKGKVEGDEFDLPRWNFTVKTINQFDNPDLYFYAKKGLFIYGIRSGGNAAKARLHRGDIILEIDSNKIKNLDDIKKVYDKAMKNLKTKKKLLISVLRNGLMHQVVLDFSRNWDKE